MVNKTAFDLSSSFQRGLKEKISCREKIKLSDGKQHMWSKVFIAALATSFGTFVTLCLLLFGLSWLLFICTVGMTVVIFSLWLFSRKMAEIAVKGDVLLVKPIIGLHKVTSLSSVKHFKSRSFLKLSLTSLSFYLDGSLTKIISFRILQEKDPLPEQVFQFILENKR